MFYNLIMSLVEMILTKGELGYGRSKRTGRRKC